MKRDPVTVFVGRHETNLMPHVEEAIVALGYVRPDHAAWLAAGIRQHWLDGSPGRYLRSEGREMTKERKQEFRLGHARMSEEAWAALTAKGQANPIHGLDVTCGRVVSSLYRHKQRAEIDRWAAQAAGAFVAVSPIIAASDPCGAAAATSDRFFALDAYPPYPLPACNSEACRCSWRFCTRHEIEKTGNPVEHWR